MSYPIPQVLWESIDAILFNKAKSLAKDIATELGMPPQPLIDAIKKMEIGKFTLASEDDDTVYQCQALVQRGLIYMRCRNPTLGAAPRLCSCHGNDKYSVDKPALPELKRITTTEGIFFTDDSTVYNTQAKPCGTLKNGVVTLFEVE